MSRAGKVIFVKTSIKLLLDIYFLEKIFSRWDDKSKGSLQIFQHNDTQMFNFTNKKLIL